MSSDQGWRLISQSAEYALRGVLLLAREGDETCPASELAASLGVPEHYLARVLNGLAQAGVIASVRGRHGGFALARPADTLTLAEVVAPFRPDVQPHPCLLYDRPCNAAEPCIAHERWQSVAAGVRDFFDRTTVADLLKEERTPDAPFVETGTRLEHPSSGRVEEIVR